MKFNVNVQATAKAANFIIEADNAEEAGTVAQAFIAEHWPSAEHPIRAAKITEASDDAQVSEGINV